MTPFWPIWPGRGQNPLFSLCLPGPLRPPLNLGGLQGVQKGSKTRQNGHFWPPRGSQGVPGVLLVLMGKWPPRGQKGVKKGVFWPFRAVQIHGLIRCGIWPKGAKKGSFLTPFWPPRPPFGGHFDPYFGPLLGVKKGVKNEPFWLKTPCLLPHDLKHRGPKRGSKKGSKKGSFWPPKVGLGGQK